MAYINGLLAAFDEQMRSAPSDPRAGVTIEQDGPLLRRVGPPHGLVLAPRDVGVRGAELDRLIARQREVFAARGERVKWKVHGHDEPKDLSDRLRAAGFVAGERTTVAIGRAAVVVAAAQRLLPDGVTLRQVTADADLYRISDLQTAVWGPEWGWLGDDLIARIAAAPEEIAVLAAEADGEVVSAAWLILRAGTEFAHLLGGTTLPAWRGRGIYRALVAARAEIAVARGAGFLLVDASDDGAQILRRLGFAAVTTATPYVWSPPRR